MSSLSLVRIERSNKNILEYLVEHDLIPEVLLSPIGTISTSGRLVQFQFMLRFFEIFM